jgi:hypothetical protein
MCDNLKLLRLGFYAWITLISTAYITEAASSGQVIYVDL